MWDIDPYIKFASKRAKMAGLGGKRLTAALEPGTL
jgi:hypothetical protein